MNRTFALAAMATAMSCASIAPAQDAGQLVHREAVGFADLDLRTASGIRTLDRRILSAVQAACGTVPDIDIAGSNAAHRCQKRLLAGISGQRNKAIAADHDVSLAKLDSAR